jgi:hypothetical protein
MFRVASREDETTKDHKKNMGRYFFNRNTIYCDVLLNCSIIQKKKLLVEKKTFCKSQELHEEKKYKKKKKCSVKMFLTLQYIHLHFHFY